MRTKAFFYGFGFAILVVAFSAGAVLAGTSKIRVTSCQEVTDGVEIQRFGRTSALKNGCRNAGHGERQYTFTCADATTYAVDWQDGCRISGSSALVDPKKVGPFNVSACSNISDGVSISRFGRSYNLKNSCRKTSNGERLYAFACATDSSYVVGYTDDCDNEMNTVCAFERALNGECVIEADKEYERLFSVVIDGHPSSTYSGLTSASLVYEVPVEGGMSRFIAYYPESTEVQRIGPVRSVRSYIVNILREYKNPFYFHVGGSPGGLALANALSIPHADELSNTSLLFSRDMQIPEPHNAFAQLGISIQHPNSVVGQSFDAWTYSHKKQCESDCTKRIIISGAGYGPSKMQADWRYNTQTGLYARSYYTVPLRDEVGQVSADTIIVQKTKGWVMDNEGRLSIQLTGRGEAIIFREGYKIDGYWERNGFDGRTRFIDADGNPISLKAGKIWVEMVTQDMHITSSRF